MPRMRTGGTAAVMALGSGGGTSTRRLYRSRSQRGENRRINLAALGGIELRTGHGNFAQPADGPAWQGGPVLGQLFGGDLRHQIDLIILSVVIDILVKRAVEQEPLPVVRHEEVEWHVPKPHVPDRCPLRHGLSPS